MSAEPKNDPAFKIIEVNTATGEVVIVVKKGILGPMGNQLTETKEGRKAASILRAMGWLIKACGDVLYGKHPVEDTDLDPSIVTDQAPSEEEEEVEVLNTSVTVEK